MKTFATLFLASSIFACAAPVETSETTDEEAALRSGNFGVGWHTATGYDNEFNAYHFLSILVPVGATVYNDTATCWFQQQNGRTGSYTTDTLKRLAKVGRNEFRDEYYVEQTGVRYCSFNFYLYNPTFVQAKGGEID